MIDRDISVQVQQLVFGAFRFDTENNQLWYGDELILLRAKSSAVLCYLITHPRQLISKTELIKNVWRGGYVSKVALRVCIREIRIALKETATEPQFIQTQGQQGYRFIAPIYVIPSLSSPETELGLGLHSDALMVGRDAELKMLLRCLKKVWQGERQCVFVTGEAGLGKTTLMKAFLKNATNQVGVWVGLGQCVEHYGSGEAYRPILEALSRLCQGPSGAELISLLKRHAPTWLLQMPALLSSIELQKLQATISETTQKRMLREMAEALEVITRKHVLILVIEDLHWSDYSTIELLAVLARRPELARLLVLCSYRPFEILSNTHPLKNAKEELEFHEHCLEIPLSYLSQASVSDYLSLRFLQTESLLSLAQLIHQKADGNALFMVNVVNFLIDGDLITQTNCGWVVNKDSKAMAKFVQSIPKNLRQMIEHQFEKPDIEKQRLLRVASVEGVEFTTASVAAGLETRLETIEEQFEESARHWPFVRFVKLVEWPDGTLTSCYQFSHALYQKVAYEQLSTARQVHLHGLIGERKAQGYGDLANEIAEQLYLHFIKARLHNRAVPYCHQAGKNAIQRNAQREASHFLKQGLELLQGLPECTETKQQELALNLTFGSVLMNTLGFSAPEVKHLYERARTLCSQLEDPPQLFHVLMGLWSYYLLSGELTIALELAQEIFANAQQSQDSCELLASHNVMATSLYPLGKIKESLAHAKKGSAIYNPEQHHSLAYLYAEDPGVSCQCTVMLNLLVMGYADQARELGDNILKLTEQLNHSPSTVQALGYTSVCHQYYQDLELLYRQTEQTIRLSEQQCFPFWLATGHLIQGWVRIQLGDIEPGMSEIKQALKDITATGAMLYLSYYLAIYAEACLIAGQFQKGLDAVNEALAYVDSSGEQMHAAELYRLKGELFLQLNHKENDAEACYQKAINIAHRQGVKFFELRATMGLSRLWQKQGRQEQARQQLNEIYEWFREGFTTVDLQKARMLLEELALTKCKT